MVHFCELDYLFWFTVIRGGSGDAYNLSGLILEQALVSPIPNALMLSFLRHSLAAQTISHGSVLEAIATYSDFNYLKTRFVQSICFISNRWKSDWSTALSNKGPLTKSCSFSMMALKYFLKPRRSQND